MTVTLEIKAESSDSFKIIKNNQNLLKLIGGLRIPSSPERRFTSSNFTVSDIAKKFRSPKYKNHQGSISLYEPLSIKDIVEIIDNLKYDMYRDLSGLDEEIELNEKGSIALIEYLNDPKPELKNMLKNLDDIFTPEILKSLRNDEDF